MNKTTRGLGAAACSIASILVWLFAIARTNLVDSIEQIGGLLAPVLMIVFVLSLVVFAFLIVSMWLQVWKLDKRDE